ncbi:MAG: hypothetical protein LBR19_08945 [Bifidobacteriaceae bacterium]|jgi:hypothetical protein|nr:hypothetical protein [Bifidobacteriaceae bacterium]
MKEKLFPPNERMPMWLAIAITVVCSIPFGAWLDKFSLPLFVSFTVWGLYFLFGANIQGAVKVIIPCFIAGGFGALLVQMFAMALVKAFGSDFVSSFFNSKLDKADWGIVIAYFIGFCVVVGSMAFVPLFQKGTLPFYTGIALSLGVIFFGQAIGLGSAWLGEPTNTFVLAISSYIHCVVAMILGCGLGWLSVTLNGAKAPAEAPAS